MNREVTICTALIERSTGIGQNFKHVDLTGLCGEKHCGTESLRFSTFGLELGQKAVHHFLVAHHHGIVNHSFAVAILDIGLCTVIEQVVQHDHVALVGGNGHGIVAVVCRSIDFEGCLQENRHLGGIATSGVRNKLVRGEGNLLLGQVLTHGLRVVRVHLVVTAGNGHHQGSGTESQHLFLHKNLLQMRFCLILV